MARIAVRAAVLAFLAGSSFADDSSNRPAEYDRFNYDTTIRADDHNDFGPEDWGRVRCPDTETCLGWTDSFDEAVGWSFKGDNACQWCPAGKGCGTTNHQSPINVLRDVTKESHPLYNPCIDGHWMKFFDSTCTMEELQRNNAFSIERHSLRIAQPTEKLADGSYRIGCQSEVGRRWGKIDFAKGFSDWWHLSHTDLHVPSEHTQNGKRYDGEIQLYHFYSVTGEEAGVNNEMGTVTFFLQTYDDTPDYDMLNRVICQWRRAEDQNRAACGLPSVETEYPGCHSYSRGNTASTTAGRKLRTEGNATLAPKPLSAHDIIIHNYLNQGADRKVITMDEEDYKDEDDFDWEGFIADVYESERQVQNRRHLRDYDHVGPWHNYWPLIGVKTEYYYRYSGSQTIPPCYGRFVQGNNRAQSNNWRVMKDPIRISKRQLNELHRLLRERIAPPTDPLVACQADTAGKVDPTTNFINVARPLQENENANHMTYCECVNWGSQWEEDKDYCRIYRDDSETRLFKHPYNFYTDGF